VAVHLDLSAADEGQRQMGERRQVAGRPDRALRRHDRVDPEAHEVEEPLRHDGACAGVAEGEGVGAEDQHRPDHVSREWLADPRGMAHQQVLLEPLGVRPVDDPVRQGARSRGHAVDHRALVDE
jgi:hypothetical protein